MKKTGLQQTAILIFANSAEVDAQNKTSIAKVGLFNELTSHTLKIVNKSGLPFFHYSEKEQAGNTFGERFSNAIQHIYDKGFKNVIAIGNDSPELKPHHLIEAEKQLQYGKTVLGPTVDGGFYLIGLHRSNFDAQLFKKLPWRRVGLFRKIFQLFGVDTTAVFTLPKLRDIDVLDDITRIANYSKHIGTGLWNVLAIFLKKTLQYTEAQPLLWENRFMNRSFNKGSPFAPLLLK